MAETRCKHGLRICSKCVIVSDAAKRMSDIINGVITFSKDMAIKNCVMAIRLSDGGSDGVVYDNKEDAIRHQLHEHQCAYFYFRNAMGGTTPRDCQLFLNMYREAYDNGMRLSEPQAPVMIVPTAYYDKLMGIQRGRL